MATRGRPRPLMKMHRSNNSRIQFLSFYRLPISEMTIMTGLRASVGCLVSEREDCCRQDRVSHSRSQTHLTNHNGRLTHAKGKGTRSSTPRPTTGCLCLTSFLQCRRLSESNAISRKIPLSEQTLSKNVNGKTSGNGEIGDHGSSSEHHWTYSK